MGIWRGVWEYAKLILIAVLANQTFGASGECVPCSQLSAQKEMGEAVSYYKMEVRETMSTNDSAEKKQGNAPAKKSELWEYIRMFIKVVIAVLIINNVVLINAKIPSGSMENTIMTGDRIFGFRLSYGLNLELFGKQLVSVKWGDPKRYDIVIFHCPDESSSEYGTLFIKRVIGLPGETVEIKDGKVYIDGSEVPLDDSFIPEEMEGSYGPYVVPEDSYFMLGDNRNNSNDSRFWGSTNFVSFDQIVGKAVVRYWPSIKLLGYEGEE